MTDITRTPIVFRDIGAASETVRVSCWLVEEGHVVAAGDRLVEVHLQGITFDVPAPTAGVLCQVIKHPNTVVVPGDVLGWIEVENERGETGSPHS